MKEPKSNTGVIEAVKLIEKNSKLTREELNRCIEGADLQEEWFIAKVEKRCGKYIKREGRDYILGQDKIPAMVIDDEHEIFERISEILGSPPGILSILMER